MIEQQKSAEGIPAEIDAAFEADRLFLNQIMTDEPFREAVSLSFQLIVPKDDRKQALYEARKEARTYVRREKNAVVFDPSRLTAYIYEPHKPLRIARGNPSPPLEERLRWPDEED